VNNAQKRKNQAATEATLNNTMSLNTSQSTEEGNDQTDESFRINDSNGIQCTDKPTLTKNAHHAILPVLLLEFLSLSITRAVLPSLLLSRYKSQTYIIMGCAECIRGILAFFACPFFGRVSDVWGRKRCLMVTVAGTLLPVCSLAFFGEQESTITRSVDGGLYNDTAGLIMEDSSESLFFFSLYSRHSLHVVNRIDLFVFLLSLSGLFSSTFTLTFAYISDVVQDKNGRVAAYGLALATFGLSFTIGPLLGGYLANVDEMGRGLGGRNDDGNHHNWIIDGLLSFGNGDNADNREDGGGRMLMGAASSSSTTNSNDRLDTIHPTGQHRVFMTSFILALLDLLYIHYYLPESLTIKRSNYNTTTDKEEEEDDSTIMMATTSTESNTPLPSTVGVSPIRPSSHWNPFDSVKYLTSDPLLSIIGKITFIYYTALHAVVSTLILYAVRQFHLGPHRLGELMAALGLSTMLSEAMLVRVAIPALGERNAMRVGLASFALQCTLLAVATEPWHLFACAVLAVPGNLVYPSVSSLVSASVRPDMVGRALGAVNGVKSLTEGVGPLLFGTLLTVSEKDALPGWPYFIAACMSVLAFRVGGSLPFGDRDEEYEMSSSAGMGYYKKYNINLREEEEGEDLLGSR
jgi:MFS family permease